MIKEAGKAFVNLLQKKKKKFDIVLSVLIILAVIILVLVFIYIFSLIEEKGIELGENVIEVSLNENKTQAYLKVDANESVEKIKFVFIDDKNQRYTFETSPVVNEFTISAKDAGLESFRNIKNVSAVFSYKEFENPIPPEDEDGEEEIPIPDECVPNCAGKHCGDDGCGGECGSCSTGKRCENGICVDDICVADLTSVTCANNLCGMQKNNCGIDVNCSIINSVSCLTCVSKTKQEICGTWKCGDKINNCGTNILCGNCNSGYNCINGQCIVEESFDCSQCSPSNVRCVDDTAGSCQEYTTIQAAVNAASAGDTILVNSGRYKESVHITKSGISLKGIGMPIVDGEKTRNYGFYSSSDSDNFDDITIEGFEVKNQNTKGIYFYGYQKERIKIRNNKIHNIWQRGIEIVKGSYHIIEGNEIYMIGNDGEAMGIKNDRTKNSIIQNNSIYLARKEGIRNIRDESSIVRNNIIFLTSGGIDYNQDSKGTFIYNNYLYKNDIAFGVKHVKCGTSEWNRIWHNTVYKSYGSGYRMGVNPSDSYPDYCSTYDPDDTTTYDFDCFSFKNNIVVSSGNAHLYETRDLTGFNLEIDGNLYYKEANNPKYYYKSELYCSEGDINAYSLSEIKSKTSYEDDGKDFNPQLIDPEKGNLDYPDSSDAAKGSLTLNSPLKNQLGARGLVNSLPNFEEVKITPISASDNPDLMGLSVDGIYTTMWHSDVGKTTNQWIIFDLGSKKSFEYIILKPYGDEAEYNTRNFKFEVSDNNGDYTLLYSGTNDNRGSQFIYELSSPASTRYLKFTMLDKFPDDGKSWSQNYISFGELIIGNLVQL